MDQIKIKQALISVSDKTGLIAFARSLQGMGIRLLSTGGTYRKLQNAGIPVREISQYTGFPEMMDGRVKTLHPNIHAGILARAGNEEDTRAMQEHGIESIDLVVVNLYPFERVVSDPDCDLATAIENIDIGGPAMVRSAAKNYTRVTTLVDLADYADVLAELQTHDGGISLATRFALASKAFALIAAYDGAISNYLGSIADPAGHKRSFPATFTLHFEKAEDMRYGENPHQQAALYVDRNCPDRWITAAEKLQGKELSYNNVADTDAAWTCVQSFEKPACVIVKHANPCGAAVSDDINRAYRLAFTTDPTSAFGGIIAFNRNLDHLTAASIIDNQFVEVVIAPAVTEQAAEVFAKKKNIRVLACGTSADGFDQVVDFKRVSGGLLVQEMDRGCIDDSDLQVVTRRAPSEAEMEDLKFAWIIAKFVKSNAIVYASNGRTIGVGAGQMSRVYSARIAAIKAADEKLKVAGSVMASDAFFPFRDGIDAAAEAGVTAVIQPGGSIRDQEVIAAADDADMAMVFTGMRHFRH